jgi:tRNA-splicing ligase RtcB
MKKTLTPEEVLADLAEKGITIRVGNIKGISEEAPASYKDVTEVVDICITLFTSLTCIIGHKAGISKKAFRLEPVCVVKG